MERFITSEEAVKVLGISPRTLHHYRNAKKDPA